MHPYLIPIHQELLGDIFNRILVFPYCAQQPIQTHIDFFDFVHLGDDAMFHKKGTVNVHNFHYYPTSNPI